jgi:UDP-GlcNAc:undecaprenyl-phosphate GlcNAc-1-phosphate transferase
MPETLVLPLLALALGFAFTWLSMPLARALGILDKPGAIKIHQVITPRFGGLGILAGTLIPLWWGGVVRGPEVWGLFVMGLTGGLDDRFDLPPKAKLLGQALAGSLLGLGLLQQSGSFLLAVLGFVLALGLSNAVNLMDGMDGLAGGSSFLTCAGLALLNAKLGRAWGLEACAAAALLGFLFWNYPKAKTFMGDVGSLAIGYLLALSIGRLGLAGPGPLLLGLLLAALPCYDVALGILRRSLKGRPWFEGDRDHFYDQLHRRLGNPVATIWVVYAATLLLWAVALPLSATSLPFALMKWAALLLLLLLLTFSFNLHRGNAPS